MTAPFPSRIEKAFSFAQETAKQLLTLAAGIFALTLTFLKDAAGKDPSGKVFLEVGWGFYLASILFGIMLLMTLAGNIERPHKGTGNDSIYSPNIKLFAAAQVLTFMTALILSMVFGVRAL